MKVSFVAGFGPIVRDLDASRAFWGTGLGIPLEEAAPSYWASDDLEGVKALRCGLSARPPSRASA
jgi:hypothetical protein